MKRAISSCIPILYKLENIEPLIATLYDFANECGNYEFESIFYDNNSSDGSWEKSNIESQESTYLRN